MRLVGPKPKKNPQQQRDEQIAASLTRVAAAAQEFARASLYRDDIIEDCLVAEEADSDRLLEELKEIEARKKRLCSLRDGSPKSD